MQRKRTRDRASRDSDGALLIRSPFAKARWWLPALRSSVARCTASGTRTRNQKRGREAPFLVPDIVRSYLILDSLNSTCLRATGSYFFLTSLSVMVREFFLAT